MKLDSPKKKFIFATVIVAIFLVLFIVISSGKKENAQQTGVSASPTPFSGSGAAGGDNLGGVVFDDAGKIDTNKPGAKWNTYKLDQDVTFQLPPEVEILSNENQTRIEVGVNNQSLEGAKDILINIYTYNTDGKSIFQIAQSDLNSELSDFVQLSKPVAAVTYGENKGYTFSITGLGLVDNYYFDIGGGKYVRIVSYVQDPKNELAAEIVNNILISLKS